MDDSMIEYERRLLEELDEECLAQPERSFASYKCSLLDRQEEPEMNVFSSFVKDLRQEISQTKKLFASKQSLASENNPDRNRIEASAAKEIPNDSSFFDPKIDPKDNTLLQEGEVESEEEKLEPPCVSKPFFCVNPYRELEQMLVEVR